MSDYRECYDSVQSTDKHTNQLINGHCGAVIDLGVGSRNGCRPIQVMPVVGLPLDGTGAGETMTSVVEARSNSGKQESWNDIRAPTTSKPNGQMEMSVGKDDLISQRDNYSYMYHGRNRNSKTKLFNIIIATDQ